MRGFLDGLSDMMGEGNNLMERRKGYQLGY